MNKEAVAKCCTCSLMKVFAPLYSSRSSKTAKNEDTEFAGNWLLVLYVF